VAERVDPPRLADDTTIDTKANVRTIRLVMLIAFALMALFNSSDLRSFTRDLPDHWVSDRLVLMSDQWHELMLALGTAHAQPIIRELFDELREMRW